MNNNESTQPLHFERINSRNAAVLRATLQTEDFDIKVDVTLWGHTRKDTRKARVYVAGQEDVDYREAYAMPEGDVKDAVFKVLNRKEVANMKKVIEEARQSVELVDNILSDKRIAFSRTAGCSCGCSPAFVPSAHLGVDGTYTNYQGDVAFASSMKVRYLWITKKAPKA